MNVALSVVIWNSTFATAWTGVWHQHQRDRLIAELDRIQSTLMDNSKVQQTRAAAQLRDVNSAMTATLSLLIERRHENSRHQRSADRAALMGNDRPDQQIKPVSEQCVWELYTANKDRRRRKENTSEIVRVAAASTIEEALEVMTPDSVGVISPEATMTDEDSATDE